MHAVTMHITTEHVHINVGSAHKKSKCDARSNVGVHTDAFSLRRNLNSTVFQTCLKFMPDFNHFFALGFTSGFIIKVP